MSGPWHSTKRMGPDKCIPCTPVVAVTHSGHSAVLSTLCMRRRARAASQWKQHLAYAFSQLHTLWQGAMPANTRLPIVSLLRAHV